MLDSKRGADMRNSRALSKEATKIFNKLISKIDPATGHVRIGKPGGVFMQVVVEKLPNREYSIAHYGEQNGDAMADPEMRFAIIDNEVYPISVRMDYTGYYKDCAGDEYYEKGLPIFDIKEQADMASFANMWMRNIKHQQGI